MGKRETLVGARMEKLELSHELMMMECIGEERQEVAYGAAGNA